MVLGGFHPHLLCGDFLSLPTFFRAVSSHVLWNRRTQPQYSRLQDVQGMSDEHLQSEDRRCGARTTDDAKITQATPNSFIGAIVMLNGRPGWAVTAANAGDVSYNLMHPIVGLKSRVPRSDVEKGFQDQHDKEQSYLRATRKILPAWAYREHLVKSIFSINEHCDFMSMVVGPCIPVARAIALFTLLAQFISLATGRAITACSDALVAGYSPWIFIIMLPIIVIRALVELWMLTYALSYFGRYTKAFDFCGLPVPFEIWLAFYCLSSACNFLDAITDSFFTSILWETYECNSSFRNVWTSVWDDSLFRGIPESSTRWVASFAWCLSLIQIVVPFIRTFRRSDLQCKTQHSAGVVNPDCRSLCGANLSHDAVLFGLADASGMASLQVLALMDTKNSLKEFDKLLQDEEHFIKMEGLHDVDLLSSQMLERIFLVGILETCVQTNIQSTFYAVCKACRHLSGEERIQFQGLASLLISFVTWLLRWGEVSEYLKLVDATLQLANAHTGVLGSDLISCVSSIRRKRRIFVAGCLTMIPCIFYAGATVAMAQVCPHSVWNFKGCVNLQT